jgi:hypothetical protein
MKNAVASSNNNNGYNDRRYWSPWFPAQKVPGYDHGVLTGRTTVVKYGATMHSLWQLRWPEAT